MMTSEAFVFGMAGMGLISLLLIVALVLGVAALAKYLFSRTRQSEENAQENTRGDHEFQPGK